MFEALPVCLPLAVLTVATARIDGWGSTGAAVFFFAPVAYIPADASGIVPLRSLAWTVGPAGLAMRTFGMLKG